MTTDWKSLCAELVEKVGFITWGSGTPEDLKELLNRARAALADGPAVPEGREPASVTGQPTRRQLMMLADEMGMASIGDAALYARAVLTRWGNPAPQPVPVSERLPEPEDCDVEGRCWMLGKVERDWRLINPEKSGLPHLRYCFSHWLPFHALPLPELEVSE